MPEPFDFDHAVLCHYLEHGKPATAAELAEYTGISIGRVRKIICSNKYASDCTTVDRPVRERNHGSVTHHRRVDAYQPTLSRMRAEILGSRSATA